MDPIFTNSFSVVLPLHDATDGFYYLARMRHGTSTCGALPRSKAGLANIIYHPTHRLHIAQYHQELLGRFLGSKSPVTLEDWLGHIAIDTLDHSVPSGHYPMYEEPKIDTVSSNRVLRVELEKKSRGGFARLITTFRENNSILLEADGRWTHIERDLGGPVQREDYSCSVAISDSHQNGFDIQAFNSRPVEALEYFWNIKLPVAQT